MAVQFFGETGPIRVPFRPEVTSESRDERVFEASVVEASAAEQLAPEQAAPNARRRPKHRATKKDAVPSNS